MRNFIKNNNDVVFYLEIRKGKNLASGECTNNSEVKYVSHDYASIVEKLKYEGTCLECAGYVSSDYNLVPDITEKRPYSWHYKSKESINSYASLYIGICKYLEVTDDDIKCREWLEEIEKEAESRNIKGC